MKKNKPLEEELGITKDELIHILFRILCALAGHGVAMKMIERESKLITGENSNENS